MSSISNLHRRILDLSALVILATLAAPAFADHDDAGVTLFRDVYFEGRQETFYGDVPDLRGTRIGNDVVSSIAVDRGCRVTIYSDAYYRGRATTLRHDEADLRHTSVGNDRVSSLRVDCPGRSYSRRPAGRYDRYDRGGRGVTVFTDAGFRGRAEVFSYDDPDLRDNPIRHDTISSVAVDPGCRVILYRDVGFRGPSTVIVDAHEDLRYSKVGNDRVSSLRVDCRR